MDYYASLYDRLNLPVIRQLSQYLHVSLGTALNLSCPRKSAICTDVFWKAMFEAGTVLELSEYEFHLSDEEVSNPQPVEASFRSANQLYSVSYNEVTKSLKFKCEEISRPGISYFLSIDMTQDLPSITEFRIAYGARRIERLLTFRFVADRIELFLAPDATSLTATTSPTRAIVNIEEIFLVDPAPLPVHFNRSHTREHLGQIWESISKIEKQFSLDY